MSLPRYGIFEPQRVCDLCHVRGCFKDFSDVGPCPQRWGEGSRSERKMESWEDGSGSEVGDPEPDDEVWYD